MENGRQKHFVQGEGEGQTLILKRLIFYPVGRRKPAEAFILDWGVNVQNSFVAQEAGCVVVRSQPGMKMKMLWKTEGQCSGLGGN